MNIKKQTSTTNTSTRRVPIKYLAIHYTAGTTSKKGAALSTAKYFAKPKTGASADFIVDDVDAVQYNPDPIHRYCWAVGTKNGPRKTKAGATLYGKATNSNTISIEICSTLKSGYVYKETSANSPGWYFTDAVLNNAVELTKYLMKTYNIPPERVIRHYDVTGKFCPGVVGWNEDTGSTWQWKKFKSRISTPEINETK